MKLTPTEIRAAVFLARRHRRAGGAVPPSVAALSERLESAVRQGEASPWRQSQPVTPPQSTCVEIIGSRLAAAILGWGVRRVQRHAADLDGHHVGDRLVFRRAAVEDFKRHLDELDDDGEG